MGHQLTTVLTSARRFAQRVVRVADEVPPVWPRGDLREALGSVRLERWVADDPVRAAQVVAPLVDHPQGLTVLRRALATDAAAEDAAELVATWCDRPGPVRLAVLDPVHRMGAAARQGSATTCGSAVLTLLAAVGDPWLALWLADGTSGLRRRPPELAGATRRQLAVLADAPPGRRFVAVQQVVRRRTSARGLLVAPWPPALGTPPWGAVAQARYPGVRFRSAVLDDTRPAELRAVLDQVSLAVGHGVPVPLYVGGDSSQGWSRAVPRHVVLAVGASGDDLVLWEPASGRSLAVPRPELLAPAGPRAALGGWTHLAWAVLPALVHAPCPHGRPVASGAAADDDGGTGRYGGVRRAGGEAMSTVPGDSSWADAGLVPPDSSEPQDPTLVTIPVEPEHQPRAPRPDLRDEAPEPDVVDQALDVPIDDADEDR